MSIILTILKITGIILLCIIGLLCFSLLIILFYPFKYRIEAKYKDTLYSKVDFKWFFNIFSGFFLYDKGVKTFKIKIFGFTVYPRKKKTNKKNKSKIKKPKEDLSKSNNNKEQISKIKENSIKENNNQNDIIQENTVDSIIENNNAKYIEPVKGKANDKTSFINRLKKTIKVAYKRIINIKYSLSRLCDKIKYVIDNISFYIELLKSDKTKLVLDKFKTALYKILRNIKPRTFNMMIHLGFKDDPDIEGMLLAVHGMLYPFHLGSIKLIPDFDTDEKEITLFIKGKIQIFVYLRIIYLLLFDKNVKELKEVFQGGLNNGRQ